MGVDAELVARCRAGDEEAFRQLVEVYHDRVYRTAFALTAERGAAEDVTQETFLRAWRGLRGFRGEATLATWLTRLAVNAGADYQRRQRRRGARERLASLVRPLSREALPAVEERDRVEGALRALPPALRRVVALRYGLDLPVAEIARTLSCPEGTVKSRLHAALGRLREQFEGEGRPGASASDAPVGEVRP